MKLKIILKSGHVEMIECPKEKVKAALESIHQGMGRSATLNFEVDLIDAGEIAMVRLLDED